jgi:asparagine synthase (glutamine-hydrolysing)
VCGLCGIVALGRPPETETAARMAAALAHRGPDGVGSFADDGVALGFRRLAIIDLSSAGDQPFASEDGRLRLLHNGEIYNYRELRRELEAHGHRFRSATDTEVLLASYRQWGERCVERFNGMWAFAIWDGERRTLFCSRDRFGVKPFYYRLDGDRFVFASELKAFRGEPSHELAPDLVAVRGFLDHDVGEPPDRTYFAGVRRLPPAHSLTFGPHGLRVWRHWKLEPRDAPRDPVEAVRELFLDAVRLRLRSDVPAGTCLSGGLDSSAIACTVDHLLRTEAQNARPVGERQRTFTAWFPDRGFDERPYAEAVVARTLAEPHWITFDADELVDALPAIVEAQDEPFRSSSVVAQWFVMREAAGAGLKVMLDGQGGDEVFAGYHSYFGPRFADLLGRRRLRELRAEVAGYRALHGAGALRTAAVLAQPFAPARLKRRVRTALEGGTLAHEDLRRHELCAHANGSSFDDRFRRQLQLILTGQGLPELLRYEDRNSMAHSLEARLPFLDYRLVELAFSLEARELIERGRTKSVLRRALHDLLPPLVRERVDKLGFVTPEGRWLRGAVGELAADVFASRSFAERGFVDPLAARRRLERHRRGEVEAGFELWRALSSELWARAFLDR